MRTAVVGKNKNQKTLRKNVFVYVSQLKSGSQESWDLISSFLNENACLLHQVSPFFLGQLEGGKRFPPDPGPHKTRTDLFTTAQPSSSLPN